MSRNFNRRYDYDKKPESIPVSEEVKLDDENEPTAEPEAVIEEAKPIVSELINNPVRGKVIVLSNLRSQPNKSSDILAVLAAGADLLIYDHPGDFYRVKYGNLEGYIMKNLVEKK